MYYKFIIYMEKKIFNYSNIYLMVVYCKFNLQRFNKRIQKTRPIYINVFSKNRKSYLEV